jgi:hypothetical protein
VREDFYEFCDAYTEVFGNSGFLSNGIEPKVTGIKFEVAVLQRIKSANLDTNEIIRHLR